MERVLSAFIIPTVEEYMEEPLRLKNSSYSTPHKDCIFCTIAHGEDPSTCLLYKDDEFVAFRNITPAATHHYLIIPKEHIRDGLSLKTHHIPMLIRMKQIGMEVLSEQGGDDRPYRLGYHWPPFTSVPHLHLHAISSEEEMSSYSKIIFLPGSQWFRTHAAALPDDNFEKAVAMGNELKFNMEPQSKVEAPYLAFAMEAAEADLSQGILGSKPSKKSHSLYAFS